MSVDQKDEIPTSTLSYGNFTFTVRIFQTIEQADGSQKFKPVSEEIKKSVKQKPFLDKIFKNTQKFKKFNPKQTFSFNNVTLRSNGEKFTIRFVKPEEVKQFLNAAQTLAALKQMRENRQRREAEIRKKLQKRAAARKKKA